MTLPQTYEPVYTLRAGLKPGAHDVDDGDDDSDAFAAAADIDMFMNCA